MKDSFYPRLGNTQYILGFSYLVAQQLVIPRVLLFCARQMGLHPTAIELNFVYFCVNFVFAVAVFHRFLWEDLRTFYKEFAASMKYIALGFLLYWVATIFLSFYILRFFPAFSNANDSNIQVMANDNYLLMFCGSVLLAPLVEETLYRGVVFGFVDRFNRVAAYCASTLLFTLIHVLPYISQMSALETLANMLQYLPAGICLSWAYEKGHTIFVPIVIHTAVNLIGMAAMR